MSGSQVPEARAGPGAQRAALQAVGAVVGAALGVDVEGPVDALGVVVAEHVVGAGDDAGRAPGAEPGRDDLGEQLGPLRLLGWHRPTIFGPRRRGPDTVRRCPRSSKSSATGTLAETGAGPSDRRGSGWSTPATGVAARRRGASAAALNGRRSPRRAGGASSCCSTRDDGPDRSGVRFGMTGGLVVDGQQALDRLRYGPGVFDEQVGAGPCRPSATGARSAARPAPLRLARAGARRGPARTRRPRRVTGRASAPPWRCRPGRRCRPAAPLKARLMDQERLAGVGNLLADEILWRAGLDPGRRTPLDDDELRTLHSPCARRCASSTGAAARTWAT